MYSILMSLHLRILIFFVNHFKLLIPQRWFECLYVFLSDDSVCLEEPVTLLWSY